MVEEKSNEVVEAFTAVSNLLQSHGLYLTSIEARSFGAGGAVVHTWTLPIGGFVHSTQPYLFGAKDDREALIPANRRRA